MRCLLTVQPALAHFHLVVPVARALRDLGHDVRFATSACFMPVVEGAGFRCHAAGLDWSAETYEEAFPDIVDVPAEDSGRYLLEKIFVRKCTPPMTRDVMKLAKVWPFDIVIHDLLEFGGYVAAQALGLPHVSLGISGIVTVPLVWLRTAIGSALNDVREMFALPPDADLDLLFAFLRLDFVPPSYRLPDPLLPGITRSIRPVVYDETVESDLPAYFEHLGGAPTVLISLGSVFNQHVDLFRTLLDGLRDGTMHVIVATGRDLDRSLLGVLPPSVHVESYLPFSRVAPHLDAAILHGGLTSTLTMLGAGVPVVFVPLAADHPLNARRFSELDAGLTLGRSELRGADVRRAVDSVLGRPRYRDGARRIQREMEALDGPEEAARLIEHAGRRKQPL